MTAGGSARDPMVRLPCPAGLLMPHRPPMLFLDSLIEKAGDTAIALAHVPESAFFIDPDRGLLPEFFVEIMAQTMAAASGYDALTGRQPPVFGFLVGLDKFQLWKTPAAGAVLRIEIVMIFEFGPVKIIKGTVFEDTEILAHGEVKVWEAKHQGPAQ